MNEEIKQSGIVLDGVDTYGKGRWIKFEGKNTNPEGYLENAQRLVALAQNTPWYKFESASSELELGDIYVFVDNNGEPHIQVTTRGDKISVVKGTVEDDGGLGTVEEEYIDMSIPFLERNKDIEGSKVWLEIAEQDKYLYARNRKIDECNERLTECARKIDNGEFKAEDVPAFIKDLSFLKNGNWVVKPELEERLYKIKGILAEHYKCSEEEIAIGDVNFAGTQLTRVPYKVILGNAYFGHSQIEDLGQLEIIEGDASFICSKVKQANKLRYIGGDAKFDSSQIEELEQLESIGGSAYFNYSNVKRLGKLERIGGHANFSFSPIEDLGELRSIGGDAVLCGPKLESLKNLENVGGTLGIINNTRIEDKDLERLKNIGKFVYRDNHRFFKGGTDEVDLDTLLDDLDIRAKYDYGFDRDYVDFATICWIFEDESEIIKKIDDGEFTVGDVPTFIEEYIKGINQFKSHESTYYYDDTFMRHMQNRAWQIRKVLAEYYKCSEEEIDIGGRCSGAETKVIFADHYYPSEIKDLEQLEYIVGDAYFDKNVEGLGNLREIRGDVDLRNLNLKDFGKLERVDGTVHLNDSQIDILNQLRVAGGIAGSTKLKEEYKKRIREKNTRGHNAIEGQDIGEAGFGVGVEECDEANGFLDKAMHDIDLFWTVEDSIIDDDNF